MKGKYYITKSTLIAIIVFLLAAAIVIVCGVGSSWFKNGDVKTWFNSWGTGTAATTPPDDKDPEVIAYTNAGEPIYTGCKYELPKAMVYTARTSPEYANGGEITVTARTSNPFIKGKFDWAVKFAYETDDWAQGKQATDYLSVEPTEDGSDTATIKYLAKFGTPLLIEARVRGSSGNPDSCTIDCLKSVSITDVKLGASDFGDAMDVYGKLSYGTGTVKGELSFNELSLYLTEEFEAAVQNYLTFKIDMQNYVFATQSEVTEGEVYVEAVSDLTVDYSMFIQDFDDYDQRHKDAIYFAWRQAYQDCSPAGSSVPYSNILFGYTFKYSYSGINVQSFDDYDTVGNRLTGFEYGSGVQPDAVLNGNYVV